MCVARHAQITQNSKFAISLQYLKKEVSSEVDILHADKHESFLQIDTMILMGMSSIPKVPKMASLQCLYNTSKKKLQMKLIFLYPDKHQSFLQVGLNTLEQKVFNKMMLSLSMGMLKHSQSAQSDKFAISVQFLKKKEVRDGAHLLHAGKHQSFFKLALLFLMEVARDVPSL